MSSPDRKGGVNANGEEKKPIKSIAEVQREIGQGGVTPEILHDLHISIVTEVKRISGYPRKEY